VTSSIFPPPKKAPGIREAASRATIVHTKKSTTGKLQNARHCASGPIHSRRSLISGIHSFNQRHIACVTRELPKAWGCICRLSLVVWPMSKIATIPIAGQSCMVLRTRQIRRVDGVEKMPRKTFVWTVRTPAKIY
jgi:hypothetical protein